MIASSPRPAISVIAMSRFREHGRGAEPLGHGDHPVNAHASIFHCGALTSIAFDRHLERLYCVTIWVDQLPPRIGIELEQFQTWFFLLQLFGNVTKAGGVPRLGRVPATELLASRMIVCSCNVLTDHEVRAAVAGAAPPLTARQVYGCLGCSAQCGRCARTIRRIMDEALDACPVGCACNRHPSPGG
jgi:bacterioferritin-associated ferredoxin